MLPLNFEDCGRLGYASAKALSMFAFSSFSLCANLRRRLARLKVERNLSSYVVLDDHVVNTGTLLAIRQRLRFDEAATWEHPINCKSGCCVMSGGGPHNLSDFA